MQVFGEIDISRAPRRRGKAIETGPSPVALSGAFEVALRY